MTQDKALEVLKSGANVFLTGEAGAGKSYTIERFIEWAEKAGKSVAVTASTGIAASHIDGCTIHSRSGLGIRRGLTEEQVQGVGRNPFVVEKIKGTDVLIIDEISMLDAVTVNDISNILKVVHGKLQQFGGIQVIFVGDFFQLPPVVKDKRDEMRFAFESEAWIGAQPEICYLTEQHRQNDMEFLAILSAMRRGQVTSEHKKTLLACQTTERPETKLFTHNEDVDRLNKSELDKLPGKLHTFTMQEWGVEKLIETLKRGCLSPEKLELKEGAKVMFTRNNTSAGYVNGSIGEVIRFTKQGDPVIKLATGLEIIPELAEWKYRQKKGQKKETKAYIKQLPLRLAWAITVHKSQGMSLDFAEVDLSRAFEFGQGYVAISRVRSLAGLHLSGINNQTSFMMHPRVLEMDIKFRELGA